MPAAQLAGCRWGHAARSARAFRLCQLRRYRAGRPWEELRALPATLACFQLVLTAVKSRLSRLESCWDKTHYAVCSASVVNDVFLFLLSLFYSLFGVSEAERSGPLIQAGFCFFAAVSLSSTAGGMPGSAAPLLDAGLAPRKGALRNPFPSLAEAPVISCQRSCHGTCIT